MLIYLIFLFQPQFQGGFELTFEGQPAVVSLQVPQEAFAYLQFADWRDLQVINSNGERVPSAWRIDSQKEKEISWQEIQLLAVQAQAPSDIQATSIQVLKDGTLQIRQMLQASTTNIAYVVDLGPNENNWNKIRFHFPTSWNGFGKMTLFNSQHFDQWMQVGTKTLAHLGNKDQSIYINEVALQKLKGRYLFIQCPNIELISAQVGFQEWMAKPPLWTDTVELTKGDEPNEYQVTVDGYPPIIGFRPVFPELNSTANFDIYSRLNHESQFVRKGSGYACRLSCADCDNGEFISEHILPLTKHPMWKIKLHQSEIGLGSGIPQIQFAHANVLLKFIPRGKGPFYLATGSKQIKHFQPRQWDNLVPVGLDGVHSQQNAIVGPWQIRAGNEALENLKEPISIHKWGLWSVLIIGVLTVSCLAIRLVRGKD